MTSPPDRLKRAVAMMLWQANVIPPKVMAVETRWEEAAHLSLATPVGETLRALVEAAEALTMDGGHPWTPAEGRVREATRRWLAITDEPTEEDPL